MWDVSVFLAWVMSWKVETRNFLDFAVVDFWGHWVGLAAWMSCMNFIEFGDWNSIFLVNLWILFFAKVVNLLLKGQKVNFWLKFRYKVYTLLLKRVLSCKKEFTALMIAYGEFELIGLTSSISEFNSKMISICISYYEKELKSVESLIFVFKLSLKLICVCFKRTLHKAL